MKSLGASVRRRRASEKYEAARNDNKVTDSSIVSGGTWEVRTRSRTELAVCLVERRAVSLQTKLGGLLSAPARMYQTLICVVHQGNCDANKHRGS